MKNVEEINLNYLRKEDQKYDRNSIKYYNTFVSRYLSLLYIKRIWYFRLTLLTKKKKLYS